MRWGGPPKIYLSFEQSGVSDLKVGNHQFSQRGRNPRSFLLYWIWTPHPHILCGLQVVWDSRICAIPLEQCFANLQILKLEWIKVGRESHPPGKHANIRFSSAKCSREVRLCKPLGKASSFSQLIRRSSFGERQKDDHTTKLFTLEDGGAYALTR